MAFAARLGELTEELIAVIPSISSQSDPERLNILRESSLRKLRHGNLLRTNQFNVENHLNGIEEHFRVLNRDVLADALRERLDTLSSIANKFTPETLHFLLELSDQPVQKSKLADLESLQGIERDLETHFKWEEIAKEDGWATDRDLWKKVDFTNDSSDEDYVDEESDASVKSEGNSVSSLETQHRPRPTDYLIDTRDEGVLEAVKESHSWRIAKGSARKAQKVIVSELQAVREVFFMLNGLQNNLFSPEGEPLTKYRLEHASWEAYRALLGSFGEAGRQLHVLRNFVAKPQQIPLMQVFRDAVQKSLRSFDTEISRMESNLVEIKEDTVVSLVKVLENIKPSLRPLLSLSDIIQQLEREKYPHPFRHLELLFDLAEVAQLEDNNQIYHFLGTIFFECLKVYLRPIRRWMEEGDLFDGEKTFFVANTNAQLPLSQVWQDQFMLRRKPDGTLHAPKFLQPASSKIFTTGKSVVILKQLGKHEARQEWLPEPALDFASLGASEFGSFAPFSEIFNDAFEEWMQSKHHAASATLRRALFESCGLWAVLDSLQRVYLMSNGYQSEALAFGIFKNIDLLDPKWYDRFNLTELAREAFGTAVDSHQISMSASGKDTEEDVAIARKSVRKCLPAIKIFYRTTWPIRIILSGESIAQYQAVFTSLLQLRRASYVLRRHRLLAEVMSESSDEQAIFYGLRSKLLWFCNALQFYLSNLVIAPLTSKLREDLRAAADVDEMITVHSAFSKRMLDEACLGKKLDPIHQCILDILDLAIRLEDAHKLNAKREAEETQELSRLSLSTPMEPTGTGRRGRYLQTSEVEDESFLSDQDKSAIMLNADKRYGEVLFEIREHFHKHLNFICGGLRGCARASGDAAARKWDTLAEMLEAGTREQAS